MTGYDVESGYPLHLTATLQEPLSRWLWLVKWFLAIPHYFILLFLWVAFGVLSIIAFVAVLVTGRYPRQLFDFNVGVMRWTWRVQFYAYAALGTDKYPPFTMHDVADYPAHLDVDYPERLSHGLVLVKWLLAIPHLLVVSIFTGAGTAIVVGTAGDVRLASSGLIGVLVCFAGVILLFRGRYPRQLFDLIVGLDRWVARTVCYVALMTDAYPPLRLDQGGDDPSRPDSESTSPVVQSPSAPSGAPADPVPGVSADSHWTVGKAVTVVIGAVMVCTSVALMSAGGAGLFMDRELRDGGLVTSPERHIVSQTYALSSDPLTLNDLDGPDGLYLRRLLGDLRVRATSTAASGDIFVGIAPTSDVREYLRGVGHAVVQDPGAGNEVIVGNAPQQPPTAEAFWTKSATGQGTQEVVWQPREGSWTVVVMNSSGAAGVSADVDVAAELPALAEISVALAIAGVVFLILGGLLIYVGALRARHVPPVPGPVAATSQD